MKTTTLNLAMLAGLAGAVLAAWASLANGQEFVGTIILQEPGRAREISALDGLKIPIERLDDGTCPSVKVQVGNDPIPLGFRMKIRTRLDPKTCELVIKNHSHGKPRAPSAAHTRSSLCPLPTAVYRSLCRDRMFLYPQHYLRTSTYVLMHWSEQIGVSGFSFSGHAWADQKHFIVVKDYGDSTPYPPIFQAYWAGQFVSPRTKRGAYAEPFSSARAGDDFRCSCLFELNPNPTYYQYECFGQHFLESYGCPPCRPDEICR